MVSDVYFGKVSKIITLYLIQVERFGTHVDIYLGAEEGITTCILKDVK